MWVLMPPSLPLREQAAELLSLLNDGYNTIKSSACAGLAADRWDLLDLL